jgi:GH25 family lysozyme M1 (1,4-beta-N-acetylmuramidase)
MSRPARRAMISLITVAAALASAGVGAGAVVLAVPGGGAVHGGGVARTVSLAGGEDPGARAAVAASPSRPVLAPPARTARAAASAAGSVSRVPAAAAEPPPVVDGVRRFNVGSAHSPQLSKALSGGPATTGGALPAGAGARGIDVASSQHRHGAAINWARVAGAGYKFAFVKVSEGNYYVNPYSATDLAQAQAAGLYVTAYHFAVPNVSSGASQAEYAVGSARYAAGGRDLPLALDIEYDPYGPTCYGLKAARMVAWIAAFTAETRRLTGQFPVIYTTANWWRTCTADSAAFGKDPLWIAAWGSSPAPMPPGWRDWTFWQYTSRGRVPGIDGNVDVSYFGSTAVRLVDPGAQHNTTGTAIRLQVGSLRKVAGQPPSFTAAGLPRGLSISRRGLVTGTISASATGRHVVTVTATTASGGTGSVSFIWTVTGPASSRPAPSPRPVSPSPSPSSPSPSPSSPVQTSPGTPPAPSSGSPSAASPSPSATGRSGAAP